jgi:hypothetical protein
MSESWKNRLWSLLLVCTFAFVLSVCNKAMDSSSGGSKSSSGGIAYADFKPEDISVVMFCKFNDYNKSGTNPYISVWYNCDSSDSTSLGDVVSGSTIRQGAIKHDDLISAGFRPCGGVHANNYYFCK